LKNNNIIKIAAYILVIIVIVQFLFYAKKFYDKFETLKEMEKLNSFSIVISSLMHSIQQERGAAAGYIGSEGKKFVVIFNNKIYQTNESLKHYSNYLKVYGIKDPVLKSKIELIKTDLNSLKSVREKVYNLNIDLNTELQYYTNINRQLLYVMKMLIKKSMNNELTKSLITLVSFEEAKENIGIERAILSATFSKNRWEKHLYIKFVKSKTKADVFINQALITANFDLQKIYKKYVDDEIVKKVQKYELIALNKSSDFNVDPEKWYKIITEKLNKMEKVELKIYEHNKRLIQSVEKDLIIKLVINLGMSLLIIIFVMYNMFNLYKLYTLNTENRKLKNKLIYDQLTGLYSRTFFISEFEILKAKADRNNEKIAVFFIDLDGFKAINDTLGHEAGDIVLVETAKRLKQTLRNSDIISRFGGDEFLVMTDGIKSRNDIVLIVEKIMKVITQPIDLPNDKKGIVSASVGISVYDDDGQDILDLIKKADMAMYKSKKEGKNRASFYKL